MILKLFCADTVLKSYHVKTCLFHFLSENFDKIKHLEVSLGLGVLLLIEKLKQSFKLGKLEHFFNGDINLLAGTHGKDRKKVIDILEEISSRAELEVFEVLKRVRLLDYR